MRFARIGPRGGEKPAVEFDGTWWDISSITPDIDADFLARIPAARLHAAHLAASLPSLPSTGRFGAPITKPSAVICIGMNYAAHAAESGSEVPEWPVVFFKHPNTVVGPTDAVAIPRGSTKTDWEVELGIVIGAQASYLESPADSIQHIAGFVTANDLSERYLQLEVSGGQWSKGKSAAGFTPTGPWLVTPHELDYGALGLRSWVNGESRQNSTTKDLVFDVDRIVWQLSQHMVLDPGDLILTGTPEGVALSGRFSYLSSGDVVEIEVESLGRQKTEMIDG